MLHRVKPHKHAPLLTQAVEFEKKLIIWVCTPPVIFTLDGLKSYWGNDDQVIWLWQRIESSQNKLTRFGKHVKTTIDYIKQDPSAGTRIIQCAENDLAFHQHFTDASFVFHQRRQIVNDADLKAFSPMLVDLYKKFFESGFPTVIHQNIGIINLRRRDWNENFWVSNSSLLCCPACNGPQPPRVRGKRTSQIDHFFPKEKYPFLSIHPDNLIPTCSDCNVSAHGSRDPLDHIAKDTLLDTFHPYHLPAIEHIDVSITAPQPGTGIQVTIQEKDGMRSQRINNLVRVFDLETRWADCFKGFLDSKREIIILAAQAFHSKITSVEIREFLQQDLANNQTKQESYSYVYANFLK